MSHELQLYVRVCRIECTYLSMCKACTHERFLGPEYDGSSAATAAPVNYVNVNMVIRDFGWPSSLLKATSDVTVACRPTIARLGVCQALRLSALIREDNNIVISKNVYFAVITTVVYTINSSVVAQLAGC